MVRDAFKDWVRAQGLTEKTVSTQSAQANRLEKLYGDLDSAYDADRFDALRKGLQYSKEDERSGLPNPTKIEIDGDVYANLAGYRTTLTYYGRFREAEAAGNQVDSGRSVLNLEALDELKETFLSRYQDFEGLGFQAGTGGYWDDERAYKETVLSGAREVLEDRPVSNEQLGQAFMDLLQRPPANFIGWRAFARIREAGPKAQMQVADALGDMLSHPDDVAEIAARAAEGIHPLMTGGALKNPAFGQVRSLVTTALALARPDEAIAVKTRYMQRAAKLLTGTGPILSHVMTREEYQAILSMAQAIYTVMQDDWKWQPKDLWDVQGFLWATSDEQTKGNLDEDEDELEELMPDETAIAVEPTNLILYGPPGTGKTFRTAAEAVKLCDGQVPVGGREELMKRYADLVARKRISFVTFHQSYAYEDFVEGLRPETSNDETNNEGDGNGHSGGFSLKPQPGIFRQIAELARDNRGGAAPGPSVDSSRQIFKMSIGRSGQEDNARQFQDAIEGGFVMLGWGGDIDWSSPKYSDFGAIKARWREDHPEATGNDPNITQLFALRANMQEGDFVVISDGNKRFRAIGEIAGPYEYVEDELWGYNHRRPVRWLWVNEAGLPRELIYGRGFSQVSTYQLVSKQVNWPALEQILSGSGKGLEAKGEPEPYVLIIDEINRANISKVFGELITLVEPDKRLGKENELTVTLPYSGDTFGVPANLHIIATMNTADRSIALLDTALRRRFDFQELLPDTSTLVEPSTATGVDLAAVLNGLNGRIEYLFDRDHQIGHAYFIKCQSPEDLNATMTTKIIPLLTEYFYEDWEKVRQVLAETKDRGAFIERTKLEAPAGTDAPTYEEDRWRYSVCQEFPLSAYDQLKS